MSQEGMLAEVAKNRAEARANAKQGKEEALPQGAAPIEVEDDDVAVTEPASAEGTEEVVTEVEPETLIKIGGREFTSQKEAFAYAEELERENESTKAYNQGVKEALAATAKPVEEVPVEDNFEEKFYSDPKAAIKEAEERATLKAVAIVQAEAKKEGYWKTFLDENPDLERSDAEEMLKRQWNVIGKMTDFTAAQKALATAVRADYQRKADRLKPRTELPQSRGVQAVSTGGGGGQRVTQAPKEEKVLSMSEQMRNLRKR